MNLTTDAREITALANDEENNQLSQDIEQIKNRLDMFDQRFDHVDSIVSVVAERVMKQPITMHVTCSKCGHKIEIAIIGIEKPSR
jgi:predicted Zn-ribbon and HTH transcriptional regulator